MKNKTQLSFVDTTLESLEKIMANKQTSRAYKMVALMDQAQNICDHKNDPQPPKQHNLFSDLPRANPYDICLNYFELVLLSAKENKIADRFDPSTTTEYNSGASVLSFAYKMKKEKGKEHPELKRFMKMVKEVFPEEVKENVKIERMLEEEDAFHRQQAKRYKKGELRTNAYHISKLDFHPTYTYVLLMNNACKAYKETPGIDLKKPLYNPELLVSLHLTNKNNMLIHMRLAEQVVDPTRAVKHPSKNGMCTPLEFAAEIAKTPGLEDLGTLFENRLSDHQKSLALYERAPHVFEKGHQKKPKLT